MRELSILLRLLSEETLAAVLRDADSTVDLSLEPHDLVALDQLLEQVDDELQNRVGSACIVTQ